MWTRPSALRPKTLIACLVVLATAGFVVWAVASSDSGGRATTAAVQTPPPPRASPVAVRLANAIGRASLGPRFRKVDMGAIAPFAWDRMYVFAGETGADIARRLGFEWKGAPATVPRPGQHESLLVFVRERHVAASAFFSDAIGGLGCLVAQSGYPRGTRFVVRFTHSKTAVLATAHPDAAERGCLRAVGAR